MQVITGNTVVSAIATALRSSFTTEELKNIYRDTPTQGLIAPCAFIQQVNTSFQNELRDRGTRSYLMDIRLHQTQNFDEFETWSRDMSERILYAVNPITIDGLKIKPWLIEMHENTDHNKVMHILVTYNFKVKRIDDDGIPMEILDLNEFVRTENLNQMFKQNN